MPTIIPADKYLDDGLHTELVGVWVEEKYRLIGYYARLFSTAMKKRWDQRIYIDLFSSSGMSKIKGSGRVIPASPFYALDLPDPFDRYIFCELSQQKVNDLEQRINHHFAYVDTHCIQGDSNKRISDVIAAIPKPSKDNRVLSFCLIDLQNLSNLHFETIEYIATRRFVDFLILLPTGMELQRFWDKLITHDNSTLDRFLGNHSWRDRWEREGLPEGEDFSDFVSKEFGSKMRELGFIDLGLEEAHPIYRRGKQLNYHMVFYSRNKQGVNFWRRARYGINDQMSLPL